MSSEQHAMFFIIADISGYTEYMLKNQTDYEHGTLIITHLLKSLLKEIEFPLEISKLEGDAIFLYLQMDHLPRDYREDPSLIGKKIVRFFEVFSTKLRELESSTDCQCGACAHIKHLNLKIIAHYGKATIDQIGNFRELSGVDVILAHRLLKNKVPSKRYLLLTESAYKQMILPKEANLKKSEEEDRDLGVITVYIYYPHLEEKEPVQKASSFTIAMTHIKLVAGSLALKLGLIKKQHFRNFPK